LQLYVALGQPRADMLARPAPAGPFPPQAEPVPPGAEQLPPAAAQGANP
jgi:hypothetical protein